MAGRSLQGTLPVLERMHERHPGLTLAVTQAYAEAARVCLSRYHESPAEVELVRFPEKASTLYGIIWRAADAREQAAWANTDDATRDGAYALALASAEGEFNLVAVARAETLTGADYYLGVARQMTPHDDLEKAYRLEVSGVDQGRRGIVHRRLRQKLVQVRNGSSTLPAFACVVGFEACYVAVQKVEVSHEQP